MDSNFFGYNPDTPTLRPHHRRAQSETFFHFPDHDDNNMTIPFPPTPDTGPAQLTRPPAHLRSLSVDTEFFDGFSFDSPSPLMRTSSMDGYSSATSAEFDYSSSTKVMAPDRLSELVIVDPKKAKRILANRQSAARSKERKVRYAGELERKVHTLQGEATTLSAQVTLLQRDASGLTNENKELKMKLQAIEQQAHLREALNEALRDELQRLKIAAGQITSMSRNNNSGLASHFSSCPPTFNHFSNHLSAQQQQRQQQFQMLNSVQNNPRISEQSQPNFQDSNHKA